MTATVFIAATIFGLMLAEQRVSRRHERALRAAGAIAPPGDVYRAMAVLYPAAFLAMAIEGVWRTQATTDTVGGPSWMASGLLLFIASKALKYWAMASLGPRWSFRVIVQPGLPLVTQGPYRYLSHPNYVAVVGELVSTAMMMGAIVSGPVMTAAFGAVLWARIRFEDRVLAATAPAAASAPQTSQQKG
ncbi:MAG: isoprenylcysteine carboxylmethyltransferase family protein [Vicinamibacterales bacterium]